MLKIFLLDDDSDTTEKLSEIIKNNNLGKICGIENLPSYALEELEILKPDMIILEFNLPDIDGISFVKRASHILPGISFIMVSNISDKKKIAEAYEAGISFFVQKPVDSIEISHVIQNVVKQINLNNIISRIGNLISKATDAENVKVLELGAKNGTEKKQMRNILSRMGIMGENGTEDIINICEYFIDRNENLGDLNIKEICEIFSDNPKTIEQRVRRAAAVGMSNLAYMGLNDYANPDFTDLAGRFFTFEDIRHEMDYIQKKTDSHGRVKLKKFLSQIILHSKEKH